MHNTNYEQNDRLTGNTPGYCVGWFIHRNGRNNGNDEDSQGAVDNLRLLMRVLSEISDIDAQTKQDSAENPQYVIIVKTSLNSQAKTCNNVPTPTR